MKYIVSGIVTRNNPETQEVEYLLIQSVKPYGKYEGYYFPPSGHVIEGEDEKSALRREFFEELALQIIPIKKLEENNGDFNDQVVSWYECDLVTPFSEAHKSAELSAVGFFTQQQIEAMNIWPATYAILKKYYFLYEIE